MAVEGAALEANVLRLPSFDWSSCPGDRAAMRESTDSCDAGGCDRQAGIGDGGGCSCLPRVRARRPGMGEPVARFRIPPRRDAPGALFQTAICGSRSLLYGPEIALSQADQALDSKARASGRDDDDPDRARADTEGLN